MCRITAITATDIERRAMALLMNDLMLRSNADTQPDGWGVYAAGDDMLHKAGGGYWRNNSVWMVDYVAKQKPINDGILLGHVRSASMNTSISTLEAHPFMFVRADGSTHFVAAHNGHIQGTYKDYTWQQNDPHVDSFRAFLKLSELLHLGAPITGDLIDHWMGHYEYDSAFVIAIVKDQVLYLFRNDKRPLYYAMIGNGFLFNTSEDIINATRDYAQYMLDINITEPKLIRQDMLFTIPAGTVDITGEALTLPLNQPKWKVVTPPASTAVKTVPVIPASAAPAPAPLDSTVPWWARDVDKRSKRKDDPVWNEIRQLLNPCRTGLASLYAVLFTHGSTIDDDIVDQYGRSKIDPNWQSLTDDELAAFRDYLKARPLTGDQRRVINKWNRKVDGAVEVDEHIYAFGITLFFHLPVTFVEEYLNEVTERAV